MKPTSLKRALLIDLAVAAIVVALVLVVTPGLAIVGMLAVLVLVVGGAGLVIELWQTATGRQRG